MPDRNTPLPAPADWHDAFAALPLEAPSGDGWQRIAPALARKPRQHRRLAPWAAAAAIACLALLPALPWLRMPAPAEDAAPAAAAPPVKFAPRSDAATVHAGATPASTRDSATASMDARTPARPVAATAPAPGLERLQAESARLERLLAELSGADASSGPELALGASLLAEVAGIDDALAGAELDPAARSVLWEQRVERLRALAGLAAGQRWQALYGGNSTDYALVQVH